MKKTIGVLALQGAFREHLYAIKRTGNYSLEVKEAEQLDHVDGLIIPGGESTAISKLMVKYGFIMALKDFKKPVFGTCAGAILLAKHVPNLKDPTLELMDITVDRNAYGRQVDSFEADLRIGSFSESFHGIFIRAPKIIKTGKTIEVIARYNETPVLVREDNYLAATFHPELTEDCRLHRYFIDMIKSKRTAESLN
jgi:5'-phosphate synthase pdxT subunit